MQLLAKVCKQERMNIERLFARAFVLLGGLFWFVAAIGAGTRYLEDGSEVFTQGWILLGVTLAVLAIGWFYEVLAAMILLGLTVVFVVYGFVNPAEWEIGVWATWLLFTAAPAFAAAWLFLAAARMQKTCELEEAQKAAAGTGVPA